jgi:hypothetical protein
MLSPWHGRDLRGAPTTTRTCRSRGHRERAGQPSPAGAYAFRMFGTRTALIGWDLLAADGPELRGEVSVRTGLPLIAVSGVHRAVALLARR